MPLAGKKPPLSDITGLVLNMIVPVLAIDRTMVMSFDKQRHENVGEHSFSLALQAGALAEHIDPTSSRIDTRKRG